MSCPATNEMTCVAWGPLDLDALWHRDCPVVLTQRERAAVLVEGPLPQVCRCDCRTCKRAWELDGRPLLRDGTIVRRHG